jgi:Transcriptional repressor TCF25
MKGTYRTALEWAKLLFSLDPESDPYCMSLMIHHLALRAHEFQWLLDLWQSLEADARNTGESEKLFTPYHAAPSLAYAAMSLREATKCRELLSASMQRVPWLFTRLFKELNLDAPKSIWGISPRTDAEVLFTELYVLQTKDLWNTPEATALLMEIAHTIPKVDADAYPKLPNEAMTLDVVRFIYLDNTPALMALAPSNLLHRSNNSDADPLPPDVNIFSYPAQRLAIEGRDGPRGGPGDDFFDPLAALARLLPGFRRADAENREEYEDAIHRVLEGVVQGGEGNSEDEPENEAGDSRAVPVSLARRLLNMLWRSDGAEEEEIDEAEGEETRRQYNDREFEEMWNSTDGDAETDDEMPELIDQ